MSAATDSGEQPLPYDILNRTNERTCTQKVTIPTLEKQDYQCKNVVAEVRTVHKDDKGFRRIDNDEQQRNTAAKP